MINEDLRLRPETSEVYRLLGSAQKLLLHTGWKPEIDLNLGLKKTIDWFKTPYNLASIYMTNTLYRVLSCLNSIYTPLSIITKFNVK